MARQTATTRAWENFARRSVSISARVYFILRRIIKTHYGKQLCEDLMGESTPENEKVLREQNELREEDARWHVIYVAVVVFAALVITALYLFSRQFSS
jgi:hypothetical protein